MDYEIVAYRPDLKSGMFPLQKYLWHPDLTFDVWSEYLDWKYARNPYVPAPLIYVALGAGEVVGMRGLYGARWSVGQAIQPQALLCAGDLVIAPAHRNRGIFRMLTQAALEDAAARGYTHIFNPSPGRITSLGLAAMGWRALGSIEPMRWKPFATRIAHAVRDRTVGARDLARRTWRYAERLRLAREVRQLVSRLSASRPGARRRAFERLDAAADELSRSSGGRLRLSRVPEPEAMADLVERSVRDGRIRHVRDAEYFRWRFGNPISRYRFLFWTEAGRLEAYLVLQTLILPMNRATKIADWEASSESARAGVLRAAVDRGRFRDLRTWSATLPAESKALLRDAGFRHTGEAAGVAERRILIRPIRDEMLEEDWVVDGRRLLDVADWDLRLIDSDEC